MKTFFLAEDLLKVKTNCVFSFVHEGDTSYIAIIQARDGKPVCIGSKTNNSYIYDEQSLASYIDEVKNGFCYRLKFQIEWDFTKYFNSERMMMRFINN